MSNHEFTEQEWHRKQAIKAFNSTWDLIDNSNRSEEDTLKMIHMAHSSRYHWGEIGTPLEFARGEWQVSRVYSIINCADRALFHAQASLNYCVSGNIKDFDLAFAYEAIARSYYLLNQQDDFDKYFHLALTASEDITKEDDRLYFLKELNSIQSI